MHADRSEQARMVRRNDGGHGAARRQAGDVHPGGVHRVAADDLPRQRHQHGRLAGVRALVGDVIPVPAAHLVGRGQLFRVQHHAGGLGSQLVHARAAGKVRRVLLAAVQHHQQRQKRRAALARHGLRRYIQVKAVALTLKVEHLSGEGGAARFGQRRAELGHLQ